MSVIIDNKYRWFEKTTNGVKIFVIGGIWYKDNYYESEPLCNLLLNLLKKYYDSLDIESKFKELLLEMRGHYSIIIESKISILAIVDKIQSYPIFYSKTNNELFISNSIIMIKETIGIEVKDEIACLEFQMAGYTLGNKTLYCNICQLLPGESLNYNKQSKRLSNYRYYCYYPEKMLKVDEEEYLEKLHKVTVKTFSRMIETLDGRPVWIPLSGGYDSRLVLSMLLDLKYDNLTTFSYGTPWLWEIKRVKEIVNYLGVKWHYTPYYPKDIKNIFHTKGRKEYFKFAHHFKAVPFLNDYYAIDKLRQQKVIPDDAIFINGQSGDFLSGGHIPDFPENKENDLQLLFDIIIDKHFSLWENIKSKERRDVIADELSSLLNTHKIYDLSTIELSKYHELIEWQERQSKYVVNGQRVYDWFSYDWRLPLWSDELMSFWLQIPIDVKKEQKLYIKYLTKYNPANVFEKTWSRNEYTPVDGINKALYVIGRMLSIDPYTLHQRFTRYFMAYAPFYPQKTYFEYLKDSRWHRNVVSYYAKLILESL